MLMTDDSRIWVVLCGFIRLSSQISACVSKVSTRVWCGFRTAHVRDPDAEMIDEGLTKR
jgi:hypothetical protein